MTVMHVCVSPSFAAAEAAAKTIAQATALTFQRERLGGHGRHMFKILLARTIHFFE